MAKRRELKVYIQRRGGYDRDGLVEHVVRYCVAALMSTRLANTLRITVKLRASKLAKDTRGEAHFTTITNAKSKHYTIVAQRDLPTARLVKTIAHEIRHIEQYARGRLRHGSRGGVRGWFWRPDEGRAVFNPYDSIPYEDRPWEKEARADEHLGTKARTAHEKPTGPDVRLRLRAKLRNAA